MPSIQRDDHGLHYEVTGSGPPVILGHSFLCSGEMWAPQLAPLAAHNQVINVDLRGHGRSDVVDRPFDLYDLVGDVTAVLDHLGIERAVWAGLSIGGMVALRATLVVPDRVGGLILLDTHAGAESGAKKFKYSLMAMAARVVGTALLMPQVGRMFFGPHTQQTRPELVTEWRQRFASVPPAAVFRTIAALRARDSIVDRLGEIDVPALVIVGQDDEPTPPVCAREIAAGLTGAALVEVPRAGHLVNLEQPDVVTPLMVSYLEEVGE